MGFVRFSLNVPLAANHPAKFVRHDDGQDRGDRLQRNNQRQSNENVLEVGLDERYQRL